MSSSTSTGPKAPRKDEFDIQSNADDTHTLSRTPTSGSEKVFLNGLVLDRNDYSVSGKTLTLDQSVTLTAGDRLSVEYGEHNNSDRKFEKVSIGQNNSNLSSYTTNSLFFGDSMEVYLNGSAVTEGDDYQVT